MTAEELAKSGQLPTISIAVAESIVAITPIILSSIFSPVVTLLPLHESVRVRFELLTHFRMRLQILLQGWMVLDPLAVVDQRRVLAQLLRDFPMAVEEPVHVPHRPEILAPVVAFLPPHKGVWVLFELLTHFRMLLQILLQSGMLADPVGVADQRRVLAELLGDFRMVVQKIVHARYFPPGRVVVLIY